MLKHQRTHRKKDQEIPTRRISQHIIENNDKTDWKIFNRTLSIASELVELLTEENHDLLSHVADLAELVRQNNQTITQNNQTIQKNNETIEQHLRTISESKHIIQKLQEKIQHLQKQQNHNDEHSIIKELIADNSTQIFTPNSKPIIAHQLFYQFSLSKTKPLKYSHAQVVTQDSQITKTYQSMQIDPLTYLNNERTYDIMRKTEEQRDFMNELAQVLREEKKKYEMLDITTQIKKKVFEEEMGMNQTLMTEQSSDNIAELLRAYQFTIKEYQNYANKLKGYLCQCINFIRQTQTSKEPILCTIQLQQQNKQLKNIMEGLISHITTLRNTSHITTLRDRIPQMNKG